VLISCSNTSPSSCHIYTYLGLCVYFECMPSVNILYYLHRFASFGPSTVVIDWCVLIVGDNRKTGKKKRYNWSDNHQFWESCWDYILECLLVLISRFGIVQRIASLFVSYSVYLFRSTERRWLNKIVVIYWTYPGIKPRPARGGVKTWLTWRCTPARPESGLVLINVIDGRVHVNRS